MKSRTIIGLISGMFLWAVGVSAQIPGTTGWYSIPSTTLRAVCPANGFGGSPYQFTDNCHGVTEAWNSALYDTLRNRLLIWGGGHNDYYGNELYALDLDTLALTRLNNPTLPVASSCVASLGGGTAPNVRHTYDGIEYLANTDKMFIVGGAPACATGSFLNDTWLLDLATLTWTVKNPAGTLPRADAGLVSAYDPNTGKIFVHDNLDLHTYTESTNTYARLTSNGSGLDIHMTATIDPTREKLIIIGGGVAKWYDISSGSSYTMNTLSTSGGSAIVNASSPGLAYDPVTDRIVAWAGGNTVYSLNLDTNTWTSTSPTGGPGSAIAAGTFGRWAYAPSEGVFVTYNDVDANGFAFRLTAAGPPVANFTCTPVVVDTGVNITCTETSSNAPTSWSWTFGDAGTSTAQHPTHSYASQGVYTVALTATNASGDDTLTRTNYITVDATNPSAPSGLTVGTVTASSVALSWTGSTDSGGAGLANYRLYRCTGDDCTPTSSISSPSSTSTTDSTVSASTTYGYAVDAIDAAGNASSKSSTVYATTLATDGGNFSQRCTAAGVIRCFGFDTSADLGPNPGGENYGSAYGTYIGGGTQGIGLDTAQKASGASSLKIELAPGETGNAHGEWFTNFSDDLLTTFGSNSEFYVQWRQRFTTEFIHPGTANWKQTNISQGDLPGCTPSLSTNCRGSCTDIEQVQQNNQNRGLPSGYNGCPGVPNQVETFEEPFGGSDFKLQNAMPSPYCLYSQSWDEGVAGNPGAGTNCVIYQPNEWMTFKVRVVRGACGTVGGNGVWNNSLTEYWVGREGEALIKTMSWGPYDAPASPTCDDMLYGKIWLTAYTTADQFVDGGKTWFDELIISTQDIADPSDEEGDSVSPAPPTNLRVVHP